MTGKKDVRTEIHEIISNMLENPDECGVYPTTKCYRDLENLVASSKLDLKERVTDLLNKNADLKILIADAKLAFSDLKHAPINWEPGTLANLQELEKILKRV